MAKSFAGCTDGKTKYELYIEATGFDKIFIDLKRAHVDVESMEEDLEKLKTSVQACASQAHARLQFVTRLRLVICSSYEMPVNKL